MSEPFDVIRDRDWPDRTWLTVEELVRALEVVITENRKVRIEMVGWSGKDNARRGWSVRAEVSVGDSYLSATELRRLMDAFEAQGFSVFVSPTGDDEILKVAIGMKRYEGTPGVWTSRPMISNMADNPPETNPPTFSEDPFRA